MVILISYFFLYKKTTGSVRFAWMKSFQSERGRQVERPIKCNVCSVVDQVLFDYGVRFICH